MEEEKTEEVQLVADSRWASDVAATSHGGIAAVAKALDTWGSCLLPFGLRANHLYLTAYMRQFNAKLARLFDQTVPALGHCPPGPAQQVAGAGAPGLKPKARPS